MEGGTDLLSAMNTLLKKNLFFCSLILIVTAGCSTEPQPSPVYSEVERAKIETERHRRSEEQAQLEAKRQRELAEAQEKEERRRKRLEEYEERKARERAAKIADAERREREQQELHRQAVAIANDEGTSPLPRVTAAYDRAKKDGLIAEEVARIQRESTGHDGVVLGGFRLGMDIQDAYLLGMSLFKNAALHPDIYRGSLRIRLGQAQSIDMLDSLEVAFAAGMLGDDVSFVFAEADPMTREVHSFRFTSQMVKNLLGIEGVLSNDMLARTAFHKLGLDWEYNYEYDVYVFRSPTESLVGYAKATKIADSLIVVDPGDFTLKLNY